MRGKNKKSVVKNEIPRLGVDLLGSDTPPDRLVQAIFDVEDQLKETVSLVVFATPELFRSFSFSPHIECIATSEEIYPYDDPLRAFRKKKNSSLSLGMKMLRKKQIDAFITAGNTGALFASAKLLLSTLPGIARPALLTLLPTKKHEIAVLDVGANIHVKAAHLVQFASMGIAFQKARGILSPTVGLLNIGVEAKKGTPELREAYQKLLSLNANQSQPTFIGNVEGRDVFQGHIDVLVTDGFTGNVFLKTSEGIAAFLLETLQANFPEHCSINVESMIEEFKKRLHYTEYSGAILCGAEGIVIKCHGNASSRSLYLGIMGALPLVQNDFLQQIKNQLHLDTQKFKTKRQSLN